MLDGHPVIPGAERGQPEPEVRVVVGRVFRHDLGEQHPRLVVGAGVEQRPCQGLPCRPRARLGLHGVPQELRGRRGMPGGEQLLPPDVPVVGLPSRTALAALRTHDLPPPGVSTSA